MVGFSLSDDPVCNLGENENGRYQLNLLWTSHLPQQMYPLGIQPFEDQEPTMERSMS